MAQPLMNRRATPWSLARQNGANMVLLRMAEDEGRAQRIAQLKQQHPRLTWAKIAEHVGVTERSAIKWQRTGALETENAVKLAELFGVDFDYVWWGPRPETPEMFVDRRNSPSAPVAVDRLDGDLEDRIGAIEGTLAGITNLLRQARSEQDRISGLLERQTAVLERIEGVTRHANDAADRLDDAVAQAATALRSAPPARRRAASKTAPKRTPRASR
jgi:DNA-binding XRE family transcriptional regulator